MANMTWLWVAPAVTLLAIMVMAAILLAEWIRARCCSHEHVMVNMEHNTICLHCRANLGRAMPPAEGADR